DLHFGDCVGGAAGVGVAGVEEAVGGDGGVVAVVGVPAGDVGEAVGGGVCVADVRSAGVDLDDGGVAGGEAGVVVDGGGVGSVARSEERRVGKGGGGGGGGEHDRESLRISPDPRPPGELHFGGCAGGAACAGVAGTQAAGV